MENRRGTTATAAAVKSDQLLSIYTNTAVLP